eukprot:TRINITY_DN2679_c0_g1_i1.p1 TRINITY_DN2679_c0_g1~~TRINITY_DN2679_c0_g1_i1.p1  ORF type:complete len:344 (-),score=96.62 TRINITY_DN2679_c0_g1_i1:1775-2806(-)
MNVNNTDFKFYDDIYRDGVKSRDALVISSSSTTTDVNPGASPTIKIDPPADSNAFITKGSGYFEFDVQVTFPNIHGDTIIQNPYALIDTIEYKNARKSLGQQLQHSDIMDIILSSKNEELIKELSSMAGVSFKKRLQDFGDNTNPNEPFTVVFTVTIPDIYHPYWGQHAPKDYPSCLMEDFTIQPKFENEIYKIFIGQIVDRSKIKISNLKYGYKAHTKIGVNPSDDKWDRENILIPINTVYFQDYPGSGATAINVDVLPDTFAVYCNSKSVATDVDLTSGMYAMNSTLPNLERFQYQLNGISHPQTEIQEGTQGGQQTLNAKIYNYSMSNEGIINTFKPRRL